MSYVTIRDQVIRLQSSVRGTNAKVIQDQVRKWLRLRMKQHFQVVMLQSHMRRYASRKQYQIVKGAIVDVQSFIRSSLLQNSYLESGCLHAVVAIQRACRRLIQRKHFVKVRVAATLLQSIVRMSAVRSKYWFLSEPSVILLKLHKAARKIQLTFLLWKMEGAVLEMESSAVILHRCIRGQLVRSASRFALSHMNASMRRAPLSPIARTSSPTNALTIATFSSWHRAVALAREAAAIVIQAAARRMLIRSRPRDEVPVLLGSSGTGISYLCDEGGAIRIQQLNRRRNGPLHVKELAGQRLFSKHHIISTATIHGVDCSWNTSEQLDGAIKRQIQTVQENALEKYTWSTTIDGQLTELAAQNNQRLARKRLAIVECERLVLSQQQMAAILKLQRFIRQQGVPLTQRKEGTRHSHEIQQCTVILQSVARRYLARKIILSVRRHRVQENAALRVQRMVKCWIRRRRFLAVLKVALDLQRIYRTAVSKEVVFALRRCHQETQLDQGRILKLHLDRLEAASQCIVDSSISNGFCLGPCLTRNAAKVRSEVAMLINPQVSSFPSYVEETKKFELCTNFDQTDILNSPVMDSNILNRRDSTPIRSNKSIPGDVPQNVAHFEGVKSASVTQTLDFRCLLQDGRKRIHQAHLQRLTLRDVLFVEQTPPNK